MTLNSKILAALIVPILFGGIFFSSVMDWWQTESTKEAAVYTSGEFAGQANPADIRGSYTFGDVEENFGVPAAVLAEAFGAGSSDPAAFQVKGLEELYADSPEEVGTASVRLFVAFYNGLPYDLGTDIYLPETAAGLLRDRSLSGEQVSYLEAHTLTGVPAVPDAVGTAVPAQVTQAPPGGATPPAVTTQAASSEWLVKGKTTFAELLEWGLSPQVIEGVLGMPMPATSGIKVKDFCMEKGLSFETIKVSLQAEVDRIK